MRLRTPALAVIALGSFLILTSVANAAWPSGATRTVPGQICTPFIGIDIHGVDCPFVSDYSGTADEYWGNYNSGIYADFHVNTADTVLAEGCRQSWTGSAAVCADDHEVSAAVGPIDLSAPGFSSITVGTATQWDYFYTVVASFNNGSIGWVYGVGYY